MQWLHISDKLHDFNFIQYIYKDKISDEKVNFIM